MSRGIALIFVLVSSFSYGQKAAIDINTIGGWEFINNYSISDDGQYSCYSVKNNAGISKVIFASLSGEWRLEIKSAERPVIKNGVGLFYLNIDTLCYIILGKSTYVNLMPANLVEVISSSNLLLILYLKRDLRTGGSDETSINALNINSGKNICISNPREYVYDKRANRLIVNTFSSKLHTFYITSVDMYNDFADTIIESQYDLSKISLDHLYSRLVCYLRKRGIVNEFELWGYQFSNRRFRAIIDSTTQGFRKLWVLHPSQVPSFSPDDRNIFVNIDYVQNKGNIVSKSIPNDLLLEHVSLFPSYLNNKVNDLQAVFTEKDALLVLEDTLSNRLYDHIQTAYSAKGTVSMVTCSEKYIDEVGYRRIPKKDCLVVLWDDGGKKLIKQGLRGIGSFLLSPGGRFIVYYDPSCFGLFSYDLFNDQLSCISGRGARRLFQEDFEEGDDPPPYGIAGFSGDDRFVYVYDHFDILRYELKNTSPVTCITMKQGRRDGIVFRLYQQGRTKGYISSRDIVDEHRDIILSAYNQRTQFAGFYKLDLVRGGGPNKLVMSRDSYASIIRCKNIERYLLIKGNLNSGNNLFYSDDFIHLRRISDINTERSTFNWVTCELSSWRNGEGVLMKGLIYKPENFDSTKKYPAIVQIYEKDRYGLFQYLPLEYSNGGINIPYFCSNGYIVFVPDINYKVGSPGQEIYASVISGVRSCLLTKSWIDSRRVGIQGHSFGGYEVNYLITRSNLFAAAESSAGISNYLSGYGNMNDYRTVVNSYWYSEIGQGRLGEAMWNIPNRFMKNSPIFGVKRIVTPILFMHNEGDNTVPFEQSLELFNALKRLHKASWMLMYNNEGHSIIGYKNTVDFSIRLSEYFDYYLKGAPVPGWLKSEQVLKIGY